jgi:hypothetical protein
MIRLSVFVRGNEPVEMTASPYFGIAGGAVWSCPGKSPLAFYRDSRWQFSEVLWSGIVFEGRCALVFGILRDPDPVSVIFNRIEINDRILCAEGVPLAEYEPRGDAWHGLSGSVSWQAFRIQNVMPKPAPALKSGRDLRPYIE